MPDDRTTALELEAILDNAGVAIVFTRDRHVYCCNRVAEDLLGWPSGTLVGQPGHVFYPDEATYAQLSAVAGPVLSRGDLLDVEQIMARRNGSTFLAHLIGRAVDPAHPERGTIWTASDITERRTQENFVRRLLREHELIFEQASVGISVTLNRQIVRCNRRMETLFGYAPGELIGQSTRISYADPDRWAALASIVDPVIRSGGVFHSEEHFVRKNGEAMLGRLTGTQLDPNDPCAGDLWLIEDITARRHAEVALKQQLREQQLIFDNAMIGISYMRDRTFLRCNRRLEEIFGYPPGGLNGQSARLLFASDADFDHAGTLVYEGTQRGTFEGVLNYVRVDQTPIWVRIIGRTLEDHEGIPFWIWVYEDVTESRAREIALQRVHQEYELIFENALVGISYMRDRIFLRCNRRLEEIFGYLPGELTGQSSMILFASIDEWESVGRQVYQETPADGMFISELRYQRKDGTPVWVQACGRRVVIDGQETWVWTHEDVSRRHAAEEALRVNNQFLEQRVLDRTQELSRQVSLLEDLIEAIPGPVYYKDKDGRYLGCNAAHTRWLNRTREQILGHTVRDILGDGSIAHEAIDRELLARGGSQVYEFELNAPGRPPRQAVMHKATFSRPDGSIGGIVAVMFDITAHKRLELRLRQAATVFENTAEGVTITQADGTIVAVNRAFTEITGYSESEVLGRNPRLLHSGRQSPEFYRQMWATIAATGRWQGEIWNRHKDGRIYPEWLTISAVRDSDGRLTHYVGVFSDITAIKAAQAQLDHQAHHDPLTGLPNRLLLDDRLRGALSRARRESLTLALLFLDLDRFKNINDTLGHDVGDRVLCAVGHRLSGLIRDADTIARLGGDEFLIVLEGIPDAGAASRIAEKILTDLRETPVIVDQEFFIGASIGISLFPADGEDVPTLMKHADIAMYRAKERGRNTYEFFTQDLTTFSLQRFRLESGLRRAIERNELRVYLQAQFALPDNRLIGAEALIRWQHPEQGLIPPGAFIPLAEESGLIVALGEWLHDEACGQWSRWLAAGVDPGVLSINASSVEFRRGQLVEHMRATLARYHLPAQRVELELTESAIMSHAEQSIAALQALRELGIALAIDDFGTGYSSLSYLKRLPITRLKIDQSFVRGLPGDADDSAITRAVLALGHSLRLKVIAEGVESEAQLDFLVGAGCDEFQGFLRGKPMPMEEFGQRFLGIRLTP